jgi:hypothetical protein
MSKAPVEKFKISEDVKSRNVKTKSENLFLYIYQRNYAL